MSDQILSSPSFHVREIPVYGDLILSPMDGYSDLPFRSLCRSLGSAMSYTEFINAIDVVGKRILPPARRKLAYLPEERPVVFQVFDSEPDRLLEAARLLESFEPDIIDVNLGCSARCVSGRGAGAGLLREPQKVADIFSSLTRAINVPITAKMRLGWDDESRNYLEIARIIVENGGALIAVHGRTRAQKYGGQADWDAIAEIKSAVSVPVIANGDVRTTADIERIQHHTGCDGVMIGRAAIGNPWIFARRDPGQIPLETMLSALRRHLASNLDYYGPEVGLLKFRKHAERYLAPFGLPPELRLQLVTAAKPEEFLGVLVSFPFPTAQ